MGTHPIFESDFDCLTEKPEVMSDITTEITGKLRLGIKKKLDSLQIDYDNDLLEYILLIFARKKRFETIIQDIEPLVENLEKSTKFASWLDDLVRKVNMLSQNVENEKYK